MELKMPNKTLLLTGFEAFLGEKINPLSACSKGIFWKENKRG
jgi:pyrrolidone-carboxylate peptidase